MKPSTRSSWRAVTVGEYRAFVKSCAEAGECRQPDHWVDTESQELNSDLPVVGVRSEDAKTFCLAMNSKRRQQWRLPTVYEVQELRAESQAIGYWAYDLGGKIGVHGVQSDSILLWGQKLQDIIRARYSEDISRDLDLRLYRRIDRNTARDGALEIVRNRDPACAVQQRFRERQVCLQRIVCHRLDCLTSSLIANSTWLKFRLSSHMSPSFKALFQLLEDICRGIEETLTIELLLSYLLAKHLIWEAIAMLCCEHPLLMSSARIAAESSFDAYCRICLINARREGTLPAWEGLSLIHE